MSLLDEELQHQAADLRTLMKDQVSALSLITPTQGSFNPPSFEVPKFTALGAQSARRNPKPNPTSSSWKSTFPFVFIQGSTPPACSFSPTEPLYNRGANNRSDTRRETYWRQSVRSSLSQGALFLTIVCLRYFCSTCNSLQNATRYTQLDVLPPVLHVSLMRFVYDPKTEGRKKSKHALSFPRELDMWPFLRKETGTNQEPVMYELTGILRHLGSSAYRGHYEAQVLDPRYAPFIWCSKSTHPYHVASMFGTCSATKMLRKWSLWRLNHQRVRL